jgi:hypothetical protein
MEFDQEFDQEFDDDDEEEEEEDEEDDEEEEKGGGADSNDNEDEYPATAAAAAWRAMSGLEVRVKSRSGRRALGTKCVPMPAHIASRPSIRSPVRPR